MQRLTLAGVVPPLIVTTSKTIANDQHLQRDAGRALNANGKTDRQLDDPTGLVPSSSTRPPCGRHCPIDDETQKVLIVADYWSFDQICVYNTFV